MEKIRQAIAEYIIVLRNSLANCHRAEDRTTYIRHLSEAAIMFAEIYLGGSLSDLKKHIVDERHTYGWGYLSDAEGQAAESAFNKLASLIEQKPES